ncbi:MAG: hypothetical protein C0594_03825 [Marinilabiliales bacterium]|nr:MAG: hypothetical protein C0594_03825 [Marinilabiliales bacterium]
MYYRLSQRDFDGKTEVLSTIYSSCNRPELDDIFIINKPGENNIIVKFRSNANESTLLYVIDNQGRAVSKKEFNSGSTEHELLIHKDEYAAGIYNIVISNSSNIFTKQFVVTHQ